MDADQVKSLLEDGIDMLKEVLEKSTNMARSGISGVPLIKIGKVKIQGAQDLAVYVDAILQTIKQQLALSEESNK